MSNPGTQISKTREPATAATRPRSPSEALEPGRAPLRPKGPRVRRESKRLSAAVRVMSGLLSLALATMVAVGAGGVLLYHQFEKPGPLEVTRTVVIPKGEARIEIAGRLEREGVIASRWSFVATHLLQSYFGHRKLDLKAGEYEFKKGASMRQVLETIAEGKAVLAKLTIPEGLTSVAIVERLKAEQNLTGDIESAPAEGALLPETYRFSRGMSRPELIERMKVDQQRLLAQLWEKRQADLPFETPDQAVVLASIIEKETARGDERDRVAAVFVNRLRKNMPLQSDPTILYGLYGGAVQWGKPILRSEIDSKTTHNTYQIRGLPPTPICNPGRPAIEAALNPAKTNDLYFVADGSGGHAFSETLKEHNTAVQAWRKHEKDVKAAKAAVAQDAAASEAIPAEQPAAPAPAAAAASTVPLPVRKPKKQ